MRDQRSVQAGFHGILVLGIELFHSDRFVFVVCPMGKRKHRFPFSKLCRVSSESHPVLLARWQRRLRQGWLQRRPSLAGSSDGRSGTARELRRAWRFWDLCQFDGTVISGFSCNNGNVSFPTRCKIRFSGRGFKNSILPQLERPYGHLRGGRGGSSLAGRKFLAWMAS